MAKLSIRELDLADKRLFMRVDFNVPLSERRVSDDSRIRACLPSIRLALQANARLILASHLGRPKGERSPEHSMAPVAERLSMLLDRQVYFLSGCVGEEVADRIATLGPSQVALLENLRFHPGETSNDPDFATQLASIADEYVNDAFGTAHRAHASTVGVPQALGRGAAGLLMEKELEYLSRVLYEPEKPVVAVFGGAKVSDKIEVIENFLNFADAILLGGGMAYTFLKAKGLPIGKSILEEDKLGVALDLLRKAERAGTTLLFPVDHVVASKLEAGVETRIVSEDGIPDDALALDIGPETVKSFRRQIAKAKTVIWNGPLGVFEIEEFAVGTLEIARAVAEGSALSVIGGGDLVAAVHKAGVADAISHISTGGGASLEFLAGKKLPGVEVLTDRSNS